MKPNILLVVIDSVRADHVSCYGYHRRTTPTMDRLAEEGCLFDRCFTAAPFSPASYASLFSNLYPHEHGVNGDTVRIWPDHWSRLPERLRELGYATFCVSNNTFVSADMNGARGFDRFEGPRTRPWMVGYHRLHRQLRRVLGDSWAKRLDSNRILCLDKGDSRASVELAAKFMDDMPEPFFGVVILMDPHALFHPDRRLFSGDSPAVRRFLSRINGRRMWPKLMAQQRSLGSEEIQIARDFYDAEVHHADTCLGRLYETLRASGRLDRTCITACSDHGEAFGERSVWGHGFGVNDWLSRVPLVIRCPGFFPSGIRCSALIQLHDVHETFLDLASGGVLNGGTLPHRLTRANDASWEGRDHVFTEFPVQTGTLSYFRQQNPTADFSDWSVDLWSARSTRWRYTEYGTLRSELHDLESDPREEVNVLAAHPEVGAQFAEILHRHRLSGTEKAPVRDAPSAGTDQGVMDRLRALGYLD